ncbi:LAQU0S14e00430g1_1 [Lachancea quebecensis]|uniref:Carnitine O-acetyltransferase, mitochondrial n=1 Tax=Lachancea quebecensis TaxID=1654605 RepID=A0A0P1KVJ9_9SACH|nr:LAQU0S14e00430g1_1 [Lachancea quebecensis]
MVSTLQKFSFETRNGESYSALRPNSYYQKKRSTFKGTTFSHQDQLPSLPVPVLEETLTKYLESVKPFCRDSEQFEEQERICQDFVQKEGVELQERLVRYSEKSRNWLSEFWDNQAYLEYNDPVVPYVSYFYSHKPLPTSHAKIQTDPLIKATAIIVSVLKFLEAVKDETLPSEHSGSTLLCMNSFQMMFNNSRVPGDGRDSNVFYSIYENNFIVVAFKGNFYKVPTHNASGGILGPADIWQQLYIITTSLDGQVRDNTKVGVGSLTSLPRNEWFRAKKELMANPLSAKSMEAVHKSSFMVCLDLDTKPITLEEKSRYAWHGDGVNRFYDKPLQFFVAGNGNSGFLAEHSKMDGTPTLHLNDYVCKHIRSLDVTEFLGQISCSAAQNDHMPQYLPFLVTPATRAHIETAQAEFHKRIGEHHLKVWHYNRYGKNFIKNVGFSPDAFLQQVIQLAVYKYFGKQLPTYEAASTRRFYKGRTETGRSVSTDSAKFVADWENPSVADSQKVASLRSSAKAHSSFLKMASAGHGIDRHFFGLKNMIQPGETMPELFKNPLFAYSSTWLVSTSQLSSEHFDGYGWSQVNDNGFGLAYMLNKDWMHINIVNKPNASGQSVARLHYYLTQAADEMFELLDSDRKHHSKL